MSTSARPVASMRALLTLALPMVLARATQAVVGATDALLTSRLGNDELTATTTGAINTFALIVLPMGTVFIVQSFASQLRGKGALADARRYAWYGLAIAAMAALIALAVIPLVGPILGLVYDGRVHAFMTDYIAIRLLSVGGAVGTEALGNWYGGLGNTWMQMVAGLITMGTNVVLAWAMIFGHLGMPAMGVAGAAWASVIATWLGTAFLGLAFWRGWGIPAGARVRAGHLSRAELGKVVRFGLPNGVNWFLEFAAFQLFVNVVMSSLGNVTLGALAVVININSVSFMPAFGLASSGAILAGAAIGRGDPDGVWPNVRLTLIATGTWMVGIGALYFIAPRTVLGWFAPPDQAAAMIDIGAPMLLVSAAWQAFDAVGLTLTETLRAAGDTTWTAGARLVLAWAVFVPAGLVAVNVLGGGAVSALLCLVLYLGLLAGALAWRYRSGAWRRIQLIEPELV